jgi:hypothetical protein
VFRRPFLLHPADFCTDTSVRVILPSRFLAESAGLREVSLESCSGDVG